MYGSFRPNDHPPYCLPCQHGQESGLDCQDMAERDIVIQQAKDTRNTWKASLLESSATYVDSSEGAVGLKSRFI